VEIMNDFKGEMWPDISFLAYIFNIKRLNLDLGPGLNIKETKA
jgi:hypothetical protein